jgi:hypothetical protein
MLTVLFRLNSKIKARDVRIKDLVTDLSDGVSAQYPFGLIHMLNADLSH